MRVTIPLQRLLALLFGTLLLGQAMAEPDLRLDGGDRAGYDSDRSDLALEGYSPVSYFEEGEPERGDAKFRTTHDDNLYYFTSEAQKRKFERNPERYAPRFPHSCPYNLAKGREVAIDPTNFKIVDGELLLFHKSPDQDGLQEWNREVRETGLSDKQLIERAENNLLDLRF